MQHINVIEVLSLCTKFVRSIKIGVYISDVAFEMRAFACQRNFLFHQNDYYVLAILDLCVSK